MLIVLEAYGEILAIREGFGDQVFPVSTAHESNADRKTTEGARWHAAPRARLHIFTFYTVP